jgi:hypothetical protein
MTADPTRTPPPEAISAIHHRHTRRRELDPLNPHRLTQRNHEQRTPGPARLLIDLAWAASIGSANAAGQRVRHLVRTDPT